MPRTSRFDCASSSLTLKDLSRKTKGVFWICFALGVAAHLSLMQLRGFGGEQKAAKPLTTQFVKRQPRLTKPLELKKRPQPKRRVVQRTMVAVKARVDRRDVSAVVVPVQLVGGLARPQADVRRITGLQEMRMEPAAIAGTIRGAMESEGMVDMSLEMMDLDALDTGRYHAMVVEDPSDKRNLTGFFHLAPVYSPNVKGVLAGSASLSGTAVSAPEAIRNVVHAVNRYTNLRADEMPAVPYNSKEMMKIPCLFVYLRPIQELQDSESENLGRYFVAGGLAFCEDDNLDNWHDAPYMRAVIKKALAAQGRAFGRDWHFEPLSQNHVLYHCFFDFGGLPMGASEFKHQDSRQEKKVPYLEGVEVSQRVIALLSLKGYIPLWGYWGDVNKTRDRTRHLQFAVNVVVFALTQEGSITHRLMDGVH